MTSHLYFDDHGDAMVLRRKLARRIASDRQLSADASAKSLTG